MSTRTTKVILNVYDLAPQINEKYSKYGFGVFHSGIEIDGVEYSFGGHEGSHTGVFRIPPRSCSGVRFRESVEVGKTTMTQREIQTTIEKLSDEFVGNSYHLLQRNCNHFSDALCRQLTGYGIPNWINRLAWYGSWFQCFLPPDMQLGPTPNSSNQGDGGRGPSPASSSPRVQVFQGQGNRLSDNNSESTSEPLLIDNSNNNSNFEISERERRERLARAALKRMEQKETQ